MKNQRSAVALAMDIARRAERALGGRMAYAEGGSASNRNMSRAISERAMRGLDPTPEQQKYLEEMQALRDQRGDENLAAIKSLGDLDIPMPDARKARQVSDRAMRGYEPTPEQRSFLDESAEGKEARSMAPATLGTIGAELTGIPAMARGTSNIGKGISEGDPYRIAGGSLETMLGMVPGAGSIGGRGLKAMANTLTGSMPRTAATVGATGFLNSVSDDAEASNRNRSEFVQNYPAVKTLIERRREAQMAMQNAEEEIITKNPAVQALQAQKIAKERELAKTNAQHARSGVETQRQALAPIQAEITRINGEIDAVANRARQPFMDEIGRINDALKGAETAAEEEFKNQATFRESFPGAPGALYGLGLGVAAGIPMVKGFGDRYMDRFVRRPGIENATTSAEKAFRTGASDAETAVAQTLLRDKLASWDRAHHPIEGLAKYTGAFGTGALTGAEFSQLPEQIDYITHEPGHRAREIAVSQLANPDYWKERIGPALLGGAAGVTGAKIPKIAPTNTEFLTAAREVASRGKEPSMLDKAIGFVTRKDAKGPTEAALADVQRYRKAVGPAPEPANTPAKSLEERLGIPPGTGVPSQAPTSAPKTSPETQTGSEGASAKPRLTERMKAQDLVLGPADLPSQPALPSSLLNFKPSEGIVPTGSTKAKPDEIESLINSLVIGDLTPGKSGRTKHNKGGNFDSDKAKVERFKKEALDILKARQDDGFARGGVVGRALQIARNMGGRVLTGPVTHRADGGRTDTVKTNLPSNSYVIPADIISSLGEGDTNAGYRVLESMFGSHETSGEHGEIPAIVAGGEYVLSPEQVAKIGGGDPDLAFQALDQFVKMQRRKHIQTLKSLPAPVKD